MVANESSVGSGGEEQEDSIPTINRKKKTVVGRIESDSLQTDHIEFDYMGMERHYYFAIENTPMVLCLPDSLHAFQDIVPTRSIGGEPVSSGSG